MIILCPQTNRYSFEIRLLLIVPPGGMGLPLILLSQHRDEKAAGRLILLLFDVNE